MKSYLKLLFLSFSFILTFLSFSSFAQVNLVPFVSNVFAVTDITHCGDDRLFIVEQEGRIRIADLQGNLNPLPYLSITGRVLNGGEQGLLGLAFSPGYATDGRFYVNYTNNSGNTVIARFNVSAGNPDIADSLSEEILFTVNQPYSNHNGGAMFFGKDGYLYISLGDGGSAGDPGDRAQNLMEDLGKLLRINVNVPSGYSIPGTNPFFGSSVENPRIWASGLRNAWRVTDDRMTGDIWIADVGQNLWEEINYQPFSSTGGENYGWRCYEGNVTYNVTGCQPASAYDFPVYVYGHPPGCSVTGGYVYRGAQYANLFGKYFFTDYCDGELRSLESNGSGGFNYISHGLFQSFQFVTFGEDKYGEMYVGKTSSGVLKLVDASCAPVAFIGSQDTINVCGSSYTFSTPQGIGFLYQWYLNNSAIPGATSDTLTVTQNGTYSVQTVNATFCSNQSDTIYLNLTPAPVVTLTGAPSIICINAPSLQLTGSPSGGNYSGAGILNDTFTPATAGVGTHIVSYTFDNGNGCIITTDETIVVDACLSLPEINNPNGFIISPNPSGDFTEILINSNISEDKKIELIDVSGRVCFSYDLSTTESKLKINTQQFSKGVYIIRMNTVTNDYFGKLIIK